MSQAAIIDGWGRPVEWLTETAGYFEANGQQRVASACRVLLRRAGAVVARRGRGDTPVPEAFRRLGVTSSEVDVLVLVAERGVAQDGSAVELAGTTADVVPRQRDGTWLVAIDSPLGGA